MKNLPSHVVVQLEGHTTAALVTVGKSGWEPLTAGVKSLMEADEWVMRKHKCRAPTTIERQAALHGAIFGWDTRGADPANWAEPA